MWLYFVFDVYIWWRCLFFFASLRREDTILINCKLKDSSGSEAWCQVRGGTVLVLQGSVDRRPVLHGRHPRHRYQPGPINTRKKTVTLTA